MVTRQEQREKRREEILRAALRLFVRKGYAGTKVGDIAEAVGMSTGLMFHYFESKEALYEELVGFGVEGPMAMMDGGAEGDALAFFEGAAEGVLSYLKGDPMMADMFVLMGNALMDDAIPERAKELLEIVGLSDRAGNYPSQLSGGQQQRVAIARALATSPKILLCDEATSALDPTTTRSILALLKEINRTLGITIIVITHEMAVIEEICQRVAIIDSSRIAEVGAVDDVFTRPQSAMAKQLIYPDGKRRALATGKRYCRIVFDGNSSFEPIVSNMVLECKAPVNIMFADTKNIDGKAYGQMILQLPEDERAAKRALA